MAKTDHLRYRPVMVHALDVLRDCSTNAERLYLRLATGKHATRIGVVVRPHDLTLEARLTVKQIDAALLELRDAELVTLSVSGAVYLTGHCRECSQKSPDNLRSWRDEAVRVLTGSRMDVLVQVLEDIGFREPTGSTTGSTTGKPVGVPRERDMERDMDKDTSPATQATATQPQLQLTSPQQEPSRPANFKYTEAAAVIAMWKQYLPGAVSPDSVMQSNIAHLRKIHNTRGQIGRAHV